jgi:hypothetical protein
VLDAAEELGTAPVCSKTGLVCLLCRPTHLDLPHHSHCTMSRPDAMYIPLPVTTDDLLPHSKESRQSFFENAQARRARRTLSFTILGTFIAVFLVLSLGSLPARLPFLPTTDEVSPQGKGQSGLAVACRGAHHLMQEATQTFRGTLGCKPAPQTTSDWTTKESGSSSLAMSTA